MANPGSGEGRAFEDLDRAWAEVRQQWPDGPDPIVVLFSGGVDSGLLAWEFRSHPGLILSTVGTVGAEDLALARSSASALGLRWVGTTVGADDVRDVALELGDLLLSVPAGRRTIFLALAIAIARAPPGTLVCGQGADELFLGYAHFRGLGPEELTARADADLRQLTSVDWPLTVEIARRWGRTIQAPFLDPRFIAAASAIPIGQRGPNPEVKGLWRAWARSRGLPEPLASRPKRALQFGSGIDRIWKGIGPPVR